MIFELMYAAIGTNTGLSQLFAKAKRFVVWFGKNMAKTQRLDTNIVNMSAEWLTFVHTRGLQRKRGKRRLFV